MAYDKYTWQTGEKITADKLNHMEEGIQECCSNEPGFSCDRQAETLFNGDITTSISQEAPFPMITLDTTIQGSSIDDLPSELYVTWDGVEYIAQLKFSGSFPVYGASIEMGAEAIDWSEYPFAISPLGAGNNEIEFLVLSENEGTYNLKLEVVDEEVTITPCFKKAVEACGISPLVIPMTTDTQEDIYTCTLGKTWQEINDAFPNAYVTHSSEGQTTMMSIFTVSEDLAMSEYKVGIISGNMLIWLSINSADGYPTYTSRDTSNVPDEEEQS